MATRIKLKRGERLIVIAMINDGINGRMPFACEAAANGRNKPGETFAQYEVRMAYHEGIIRPNYPVPAIPLEVCLYGTDEMHSTVYISDGDCIVCWWDFNWDRCMDFGLEVGEYATSIPCLEGG